MPAVEPVAFTLVASHLDDPRVFYDGGERPRFPLTVPLDRRQLVLQVDPLSAECRRWRHYYSDAELNELRRLLALKFEFRMNQETAVAPQGGRSVYFQPFWDSNREWTICYAYDEISNGHFVFWLLAVLSRDLPRSEFDARVAHIGRYWPALGDTEPHMPTAAMPHVKEIIEQNNANAVRCYASGDIDSLASMFAEDAWQMPPNSAPLIGREAIRRYWRDAMKWGTWEFMLQALEVSVSGPIAVERGRYSLRFTAGAAAPPGMPSFQDRGHYLVHWRLEPDGRWRIVSDAPVSEVPR